MARDPLESNLMAESPALALAGRGVLVTGASSGIGRAIALAVARAGADVAMTYRSNRAGADAVARDIHALGRRANVVQALDSRRRGVRFDRIGPAVRAALGRLDVWMNNAGADILTGPGASLSTGARSSTCCSPVDLRGTILASWAAATPLRRAGRRRRHHQHELGPRGERHGRHQPADVSRR